MKKHITWAPFVASLVATPVFLLLGIGSAGAGHGDYVLARILFPYTMLSAILFDVIAVPFIVLAVAQFPFYGIALGAAARRGQFLAALCLILAAHVVAAIICFLPLSDNFG